MVKLFQIVVFLVFYSLNSNVTVGTMTPLLKSNNSQADDDHGTSCPVWHYFSPAHGKCLCYGSIPEILIDTITIKCSDDGKQSVMMDLGQCMTHQEGEDAFYVAICPYFQMYGHKISEPDFVSLPDNVSELNEYMCGPMNRKGILCSECRDGFGPSFTSPGYRCSNCTNVWYGIPLYIFIELIPATIFYLIILVFRINLTSCPMSTFLFYSQLIMVELTIDRNPQINCIMFQYRYLSTLPLFFYGMWNLDFIRYSLPPFCISEKLHLAHIALLGYVSVIYPLFLIAFTWLLIELHARNCRLIVWLWRPFHRCCINLRRGWDNRSDIISVFASFMLLSYSKLIYQSILFINCPVLLKASSGELHSGNLGGTDFSTMCKSKSYLIFAIPAALVITLTSFPALLLILYPIKPFKVCLSKMKLDCAAVHTFVEKFHGCYKDGTQGDSGERDLRSFSGLYLILRVIVCLYPFMHKFLSVWAFEALLFSMTAALVAFIKPYRKIYMNVVDVLLLLLLTLLSLLMSSEYSFTQGTVVLVISLIPAMVFWFYTSLKVIFKVWRLAKSCYRKKRLYIPLNPDVNNNESCHSDQS